MKTEGGFDGCQTHQRRTTLPALQARAAQSGYWTRLLPMGEQIPAQLAWDAIR